MHDRTVLGPADVSDDALAAMAADLLGIDPDRTTLLDSRAEVVAYDLDAITTAGRYWVHGARHRRQRRAAVPDVRQARPVLEPLAVLRSSCPPTTGPRPSAPCPGAPSRWPTGRTSATACRPG